MSVLPHATALDAPGSDPADAGTIVLQSQRLCAQGQVRAALELAAAALARFPQHAVLLCHCGAYAALLQHADVAEAAYRQAIAVQPDYADAHYNLGLLLMEQQRLAEAEAAYQRALVIQPAYANAHFNLGILYKTQQRLPEARAAYQQVIALQPSHGDAQVNLGNVLVAMQRPAEALVAYRNAVALQPAHAVAQANLGALLLQHNHLAEAESALRTALALTPDSADAHTWFHLGDVLRAQSRPAQAEAAYRQALQIQPALVQAHVNLGALLLQQGRLDAAEAEQRCALALQADNVQALSNLGNVRKQQGRLREAEAAYRQAIEREPHSADAHYNLGLLLMEQQRTAEAERAFRSAIAAQPTWTDALSNLGALLSEQKRWLEAQALFQRALDVQPDHAGVHANLGVLYAAQRRWQEAEAASVRATALDPQAPVARWNLGVLLLGLGRYGEGWPAYEARYSPHHTVTPRSPQRLRADDPVWARQWHGESLEGKSLWVWPEQGFGDEIQFVRYVALLRSDNAQPSLRPRRLTLVCKQPLAALFAAQGFADQVIGIDAQSWIPAVPAEYDYWCYLASLPLQFGTTLETIPASVPYLRVRPDWLAPWTARLPAARFRVGLVWHGNPGHSNDAARSLPTLETLAPLWDVPGVAFVSLDKGHGEAQAGAPPPGQALTALGGDMADFSDTAAIVRHLDVLISVDTAAAHLAGALGVPCWVLLPAYRTDWRWLTERSDSPWYPGAMRLFRQQQDGDWQPVIAQLVAALRDWVRTLDALD